MNKKPSMTIELKMLFIVALAFMLGGCSLLINVGPGIAEVKKIGFLSVYINDRFHNRKGYKENLGMEMLGFFEEEGDSGKKETPKKLVEHFVKKFEGMMQSQLANRLEWVSPSAYIDSEPYQQPLKHSENFDAFDFDDRASMEEKYLTAYPGFKLLPLNRVVKRFNIEKEETDLNYSSISSSVSYEEIGKFTQGLGLDAVIVVEIDGSYEKLDFLEGDQLRPSITLRLLVIDKKGQAVLTIGEVFKNERKTYTGDVVSASLAGEYIDFSSNPQGLFDGYRQAIDEALLDMFHQMRSVWP